MLLQRKSITLRIITAQIVDYFQVVVAFHFKDAELSLPGGGTEPNPSPPITLTLTFNP